MCLCVSEPEGFNSSFPAVRLLVPPGGSTLSVYTEEGDEGLEWKGQLLHGGGHVRGEMKETAAGYRANEWPRFPSVIKI